MREYVKCKRPCKECIFKRNSETTVRELKTFKTYLKQILNGRSFNCHMTSEDAFDKDFDNHACIGAALFQKNLGIATIYNRELKPDRKIFFSVRKLVKSRVYRIKTYYQEQENG